MRIAALGDSLCPCRVSQYAQERDFLINLLFGPDHRGKDATFARNRTLRLLLSLLDQSTGIEDPVSQFRDVAYYGYDSESHAFQPPPDLTDVLRQWSVYETGEFVHYAIEIAFDAILKHLATPDVIDPEANGFITSLAQQALRVTSQGLGLGTTTTEWCDRLLGDIIEEARTQQKPLNDWHNDPWSEESLLGNLDKQPPLSRLLRAFACLVSILAKGRTPENPFQVFASLPADWFDRHQVSVAAVRKYMTESVSKNAADVFAGLLKEFVVGQHLKVAMRKLRYQSQSTFKLIIEDGRFVWVENFIPTYTNPRLQQAFWFLRNLGLCLGEAEEWKLTDAGGKELERRPCRLNHSLCLNASKSVHTITALS